MSNKTNSTVGGNAAPTIDTLNEFSKENTKPKPVSFANNKRCLSITHPGEYIGIPTKVVPSEDQLVVTFNIFDLNTPTLQYRSVRFWLNTEYEDGGPEDEFYQTFDNPVSSDDIIGKSCLVEIELVEKLDNSRVYPSITSFSKTS